jgi:CDP-diacylglycerol--glycerol-3-phosphate 3-phosphatidyltransferase
MNNKKIEEPKTFTDLLRRIFKNLLNGIAGFFNKIGVKPNFITIAGLIGNLMAGVFIARGMLFSGGLIALIAGPFDALDGAIARLRGEDGAYGAFIDSVTDRLSEISLYGGLLVYFNQTGNWGDALLVFFSAVGSIMVSYTRARAEALGYSAKIGLLTRVERYLILIPGIIIGYPRIALWILAILTNFTAFQRIFYVRKQSRIEE